MCCEQPHCCRHLQSGQPTTLTERVRDSRVHSAFIESRGEAGEQPGPSHGAFVGLQSVRAFEAMDFSAKHEKPSSFACSSRAARMRSMTGVLSMSPLDARVR